MKKILVTLALALILVLGCAALASADTVIGYGDLEYITSLDGHSVTWAGPDYEGFQWPTCQQYGIAYFYCQEEAHKKVNGMHTIIWGAPDWHDWVEDPDAYVAPTCTEYGSGRYVCRTCGAIGDTYVILPNGHTYENKTYKVVFGASCGDDGEGYGVIVCDVCGTPKAPAPLTKQMAATLGHYTWNAEKKLYIDEAKAWVKLQKIAHSYTDWSYKHEANCYQDGYATRTCTVCGDIQYLDADTELYEDANGNIHTKETKQKGDVDLRVKYGKIIRTNNKYKTDAYDVLNDKKFESMQQLNDAVKEVKKTADVDLVVSEEEYIDCYTRKITYVCPYCHSNWGVDDFGNWDCPHEKITVYVLEPTHVWNEYEEEYIESGYTWKSEYIADFGEKSDMNEYVRNLALKNLKSVTPTCEIPGIALYLCKNFNAEFGGEVGRHGEDLWINGVWGLDGVKTVLLLPNDHNWGAWTTKETYKKDGHFYNVEAHVCLDCGKMEHRTIVDGEIPEVVPPTGMELFVERCYRQALNRMYDPAGFRYWVDLLKTKEKTAQDVAYGFVFSPEMNATRKITEEPDALLKSLYDLYLGRDPDPEGLAYWKQRIEDGITLEELNYGFAQSVEFQGIVAGFGL